MRLLIAMMKHETNTFSPVPTPLARFGHGPGPLYGDAALKAYRGTGSGLGAYIELAEREGAEIVMPIAAGAPPSRRVDNDAYEHIAGKICDVVRAGGFDGIMLDLHGAMVTEAHEVGRRAPTPHPRDRRENADRGVARHVRTPSRSGIATSLTGPAQLLGRAEKLH